MATLKPISTISYNTESFLKEKLDNLVEQHIIQCYQYICHKGEDGDKDHIHLRIEPNKRIDPMDLTELFREYEPGKDKPRGIRPWRPSSEEDWVLYALHDEKYLALKYKGGEKGEKIPYTLEDLRASEYYDLETMLIRAKQSLAHTSMNLASRLQGGENATKLLMEGENPHLVYSLIRLLETSDYERLVHMYHDSEEKLARLEQTLLHLGYRVRWDKNDIPEIHKIEIDRVPDGFTELSGDTENDYKGQLVLEEIPF